MSYVSKTIELVKAKNPGETEFHQTIEEVLTSLEPVIEANPQFEAAGLLERITEPERQIMFRVPWTDDNGKVQVNRGFRVQFNSAIGPYKGGLRFHPSVYLGIVKFLGFEQIFKNSLTGLPIGGGKGGSDFDPKGKSDAEVMRFCQSFMTELYRHIGINCDVPAGDIGVGGREIGYMFGQYKKIRNQYDNGVLTGKGLSFGGSLIRPEATGYGATYYLVEVLKHFNTTLAGKTVAVSGYGNVAWGAALKVTELGGKVLTISGSEGYVYMENGITPEQIDYLLVMRGEGVKVSEFAAKFNLPFTKGERPWSIKADICMPCATQNEIEIEDAKTIVANGTKYIMEGSNMSSSNEALKYFAANGVVVGPAKAVNAGGVAVSALEMSQNSMRLAWTTEEVDEKLQAIMKNIHDESEKAAAEYGLGYDLVAGANIAGFLKVADAMMSQGLI